MFTSIGGLVLGVEKVLISLMLGISHFSITPFIKTKYNDQKADCAIEPSCNLVNFKSLAFLFSEYISVSQALTHFSYKNHDISENDDKKSKLLSLCISLSSILV